MMYLCVNEVYKYTDVCLSVCLAGWLSVCLSDWLSIYCSLTHYSEVEPTAPSGSESDEGNKPLRKRHFTKKQKRL